MNNKKGKIKTDKATHLHLFNISNALLSLYNDNKLDTDNKLLVISASLDMCHFTVDAVIDNVSNSNLKSHITHVVKLAKEGKIY